MSRWTRTRPISVLFLVLLVCYALSSSLVGGSRRRLGDTRTATDGDRRRVGRRATVDSLAAIFGGLEDVEQRERLIDLAGQDTVAAVLEFNEMVLSIATSNSSRARTCLMTLNYNVTASPEVLSDLFKDQVTTGNHMLYSLLFLQYFDTVGWVF